MIKKQRIAQTHVFPGQLSMIDSDPTFRYFLAGGKQNLRILQINFNNRSDYAFTLKGTIKARGTQQNNIAKPAVNDLSWNKLKKQLIAIGSTAGTVSIYDTVLEQKQIQFKSRNIYQKKQHQSHVSKIQWSPHQASLIISASLQSGMKLMDVRTKEPQIYVQIKSMQFQTEKKIRDFKFSPHNLYQIVVGYQGGGLQGGGLEIFDIRKIRNQISQTNQYPANSVLLNKCAHLQTVNSIDWNPADKYLIASGSLDKYIKIWDISSNKFVEKQKILHVSSISMIKWRNDPSTLIGASSLNSDNQIYFYDIRYKFRPHSIYKGHSDVVKCFLFDKNEQYIVSGSPMINSKDSMIVAQNIYNCIHPYKNCPQLPVLIDPFDNLVFNLEQINYASQNTNNLKFERDIVILKDNLLLNNKQMNLCQQIKYLHEKYKTKGSLDDIIQNNSRIALQLGKKSCAELWRNIFLITFPDLNQFHTIQSIYQQKIDITNNITVSDDRIVINDKSKLKKQINKIDIEPFIQHIIDQGQLQTAVTIIICLVNIDKNILKSTFVHNTIQPFIDILRKYQLYTIASRIILDCKIDTLGSTTNEYTQIKVVCGNCKKDLKQISANCQYHNQLCIRCQQPLNRLLVWCQYCGHGGHDKCYKLWFKTQNDECPYGCGHKCFILR